MTLQITIAPKHEAVRLARSLFSDVEIAEQWESDDKVAIIWSRPTGWLESYQRDRLASAMFPTYRGMDGLQALVDQLGLAPEEAQEA